jgi:Zn-dependent protease with chaperone function
MCFICDMRSASSATPSDPTAAPRAQPVWSARRAFVLAGAAAAVAPAAAQVDVGQSSVLRKLVPAGELEAAAQQQYAQMMEQAQRQQALLPANHPQVQRLRRMAQRIVPHTPTWNPRATQWRWQINLIQSPQINAFCMPGGKIAFYTGILDQLKLSDDEAAMIMGHEMAHALREHARARMAKSSATSLGLRLGAQLLGLGELGNVAADLGTQLLSLKFSREDETEADLVGLELAARSAYKPQASVSLWEKMSAASGGKGLDFLSTHPSGPNRIRELQSNVPKVQGLYEAARRG